MKHTELPWKKIESMESVSHPEFDIRVGDTLCVTSTEEDAEFIVKAVNNYYQLLEILKRIADAADSIPLAEMPAPLFNLIENQAREAIKQAEKQS